MPTSPSFDLQEILEGEFVAAHFQPIVSMGKKTIVGYEGLIRGIHPLDRGFISPSVLFGEAGKRKMVLELDRLCRKKVLEYFRGIGAERPNCLLSMNFEAAVIDQGVVGSGHLIQQVNSFGLKPQCIALEIIESNVKDVGELQKFIQTYRDFGFLIALDDVGAGHSNLNRIPLLKPDILKIDRYLVRNISKNYYKQEVFKSLVGLSRQIGALTIAEGIETEEEALTVIEMGVDMIQGFFFGKPQRYDLIDDQATVSAIERLSELFRKQVLQKLGVKRFNLRKYELMTREIQIELSKLSGGDFDQKLFELIHYFPLVECVYVLDESGIQRSETVFGELGELSKNKMMFRPREKESDHSLKDYYYMLMDGGLRKTTYVSEPYISLATGSLCVTFARLFKDKNEKVHILCMDINTQFLKQIPGSVEDPS